MSLPLRVGSWVRGLVMALVMIPGVSLARADDPVKALDTSLVILSPMEVAPLAIGEPDTPEYEAFLSWMKPVLAAVDATLAGETRPRTVVIRVTLHPDRDAEVIVAGRPQLSDEEIQALRKAVDVPKAPRSQAVDFTIAIQSKVQGGAPGDDDALKSAMDLPFVRFMTRFHEATTADQVAMMKRWARTEAIPRIAQVASKADPKFEGVVGLARTLKGWKPDADLDADVLTMKNPDFWRAMLEMSPGIPYVQTARVALLTAEGKIHAALRLAQTLAAFDRKKSAYSDLLSEFLAMAQELAHAEEEQIRKGIALHDRGEFDAAVEIYDQVIQADPGAVWAHFERYQTLMARALKAGEPVPDWAPTRTLILDADPLYTWMAGASGEEQLYDLLLRKEADELFKDRTRTVADLQRYAEIATDLGEYGFAALIEWNLVTSVKPEAYKNRDLIEDVLYNLEKLGMTGLKENFKADHKKAFERIDQERAKRREASSAGRVMKPKD